MEKREIIVKIELDIRKEQESFCDEHLLEMYVPSIVAVDYTVVNVPVQQPLKEYIEEYLSGIGGLPWGRDIKENAYNEFDMRVREALGIEQPKEIE